MAANSISNILGSDDKHYCFADPVDLKMGRKKKSCCCHCCCCCKESNKDDNKALFNVKRALFSPLQKRRVLRDDQKNPICTLRRKIMTTHERWQVFKGDSTKSKDLIFSVKRKSIFQWRKIELEVFLANNEEAAKSVCDFMVTTRFWKKSCIIEDQSSRTKIAEMKMKGGNYEVNLNPNIDSAFIVALVIILTKISRFDKVTTITLKLATTTYKLAKMMVDPTGIVTDLVFCLLRKLFRCFGCRRVEQIGRK